MLKGKNIVLGVTGGVAVYKALDIVSRLKKLDANVDVIMTKSAMEFVKPQAFQALSRNLVVTDLFETPRYWDIEHISLAQKADIFLVAPATANIIGKVANGISDDMLSTTIMASTAKIVFAPAMNTKMYENPIVQANISKLKSLGYEFINPGSGRLACGDVGAGKLAEPAEIVQYLIDLETGVEQDLIGKNILITAGPTVERIDPIRFITNRSTGKMGYAIAEAAVKRGANVTLVTGPSNLTPPAKANVIPICSAVDMYEAVKSHMDTQHIIIKSAAVADYRPETINDQKIKKQEGDMSIKLVRNPDILLELGKTKGDKVLVGFAAETNNVEEYAKCKVERKNLDFIVANDVTAKDAGFGTDTNIVKLIDKYGDIQEISSTKLDIANRILDKAKEFIK
ncbi:bifunctional phosphopantothenoylcysteine decarboxylase/phosphopantothenate--cysteine ligase CoaBC [Serpentinicella alkaliphila]|uniref:Coenzyme A biosynthesis bifunctional protein CoaBC n=1 Tax=Serpentinicella alkaliphila TaxID=1734049 RepID=A0A4R2T7A7_9FIRM|nr:bifunctional phosphopantothenoylcysteine decarboxylase/phosphopantothenate--cysteine ligase CoaBC [Serpentinicella alkaliphila]QUH26131.1 bifunctional phosphopantothenoylcysteine decarboxylase/phosphopantothenate--cysteine ligase CoaBC [Serpentinicella alkaliphila]TCP98420.1 phosphopantothenoylcysteine decarboxylase/phosphopantothenate--cysteine ligase [Serpentinicella alkaliphila]